MKTKTRTANILHAVAGFILGAAIFGGSAAVASTIMANQKTAAVIIDGADIDLKGYIIEGNHYFQLRDLSDCLKPGGKDFSIVWDGGSNRIIIDTSRGYDPNETLPSSNDSPTEPAMNLDEIKAEVIRLTNIERARAGLDELQALPELMDCAQAKADDMRENRYYGHDSPVYGSCYQMIRVFVPDAGWCSENLAPWSATPEEVVSAWLDSPGHRASILEPSATHIGIGLYARGGGGFTWVQQFAQL